MSPEAYGEETYREWNSDANSQTHITAQSARNLKVSLTFLTVLVVAMNPRTGQKIQENALLDPDCAHINVLGERMAQPLGIRCTFGMITRRIELTPVQLYSEE